MTTFEKVREIISNQISRDKESIKPEHNLITDLKVDSLEVAEMLFMLEDTLGITLEESEALKLKTVQDIVDLVDSRGV